MNFKKSGAPGGQPSPLPGLLFLAFCFAGGIIWGQVLAARVPGEVTWLCLLVFTADALVSARLLWVTGDIELLRADMG